MEAQEAYKCKQILGLCRELPVVQHSVASAARDTKGHKGKKTLDKEPYFDKSSAMISRLVNKTWFCRYPRCSAVIYDNGSEV